VKKQLAVWKELNSPKSICLMVEDNVSFHKTQQEKDAYADAKWLVEFWPPNMTDELQPMDLNVNITFKNIMRKLRGRSIYNYLQTFRDLTTAYYVKKGRGLPEASNPAPTWNPPKTTYKDVVPHVLSCIKEHLSGDGFRKSVARCFVKIGLVQLVDQYGEPAGFNNYIRNLHGGAKNISLDSKCEPTDCINGWIISFVQKHEIEDVEPVEEVADDLLSVDDSSSEDGIDGDEDSDSDADSNDDVDVGQAILPHVLNAEIEPATFPHTPLNVDIGQAILPPQVSKAAVVVPLPTQPPPKATSVVHRVVPAPKKPAGKAAEDIFKPTKTLRVTPKRKAEEAIQHPIEWIQCSKCKKWRIWRGVIGGSEDLPEKWVCAQNVNDSKHNECSVPQEK